MTALAWQWAKGVSSPIIGGTKAAYLEDAAKAFAVTLTDDDIAYLEEPYIPHESLVPLITIWQMGLCCWMKRNNCFVKNYGM